ncbi:hypothetical protein CMUST_12225 [Corynebacterium mustelae]|uniref:Uncharacterized protein n=1 Tax=Corynebacterium mustelae TaxID=571915 RepID=A0A0G3H020_9CORY|nr:hypothetical protein [Corynebacterium mustelae]AKK06754.1 hypothetical protein CMUST_12225 [Corynebacterium mustelae]
MSDEIIQLTPFDQGINALLRRVAALDESALARFKQLDSGVEVFVSTPFGVLASRRVAGTITRDGSVVKAATFVAEEFRAPAVDVIWDAGELPPAAGFQLVDVIPSDVVFRLNQSGKDLARQFSSALGPPQSLLNQTVLTATNGDMTAEIPMRMIFALNALGFIPGESAPPEIPRQLRVSRTGRWVRVDAPFGSVYLCERINLLVIR